jgi:hypothetical protein
MPRQNRVTPRGELIAVPERGTFMGNRGVLHDKEGQIKRLWQVKRWLICVLEFRGRHRAIMTPGSYTELFFLDEATALAAGHRPCAECRRVRFNDFCHSWLVGGNEPSAARRPTVAEIDDQLHVERLIPHRSKRRYEACLDDLPNGVFVQMAEEEEQAFLLWDDRLLAWSPGGYQQRRPRRKGLAVSVLTPRSTVATIQAGYVPEVHATAGLV